MPLMELKNVSKMFPVAKRKGVEIGAVVNLNLSIEAGEIIAVVGESGCGKTTLGKLIAGIHEPSSGEILYEGKNIHRFSSSKISREYRLGVQMVHQDSYAALNPYKTILHSLSLPLLRHEIAKSRKDAYEILASHFEEVGLNPPEQFLMKYPHQLSGGQRQRVVLARALSVKPKLIVADEPVSMVDVSLRISLLNLMMSMNEKYGISFVYITHDLGTARYIAKGGRIAVMYVGRMMEMNGIQRAIASPKHPYFQALVEAVPEIIRETSETIQQLPLRSLDMPNLTDLPNGCKFCPRCIYYTEICEREEPPLVPCDDGGLVACHNVERAMARERL